MYVVIKKKRSPNISKIGGNVNKICRINRRTPPQYLVSTRKIGRNARVTRKCDDCLTKIVNASTNIIAKVIH